jgi:hypothetical protein
MDRRNPGASVLDPDNMPPWKGTDAHFTAVRTARDAVAAAEDTAYADWLPLLRRRTVPKFVPARFVARYARENVDV